VANDWKTIHRLTKSGALDDLPPLIAAGGLTPETVGPVVHLLRPYAVDVSSGVESARRTKSSKLIGQFVHAVRAADADPS
jgi:phosphoribosylanthranilate isomerase